MLVSLLSHYSLFFVQLQTMFLKLDLQYYIGWASRPEVPYKRCVDAGIEKISIPASTHRLYGTSGRYAEVNVIL